MEQLDSFVRSPAARGETPAAFGRRCIPADCVAPPSNMLNILSRRALSAGRLAGLGATPDFHHGLLSRPATRTLTMVISVMAAVGRISRRRWARSSGLHPIEQCPA